MEEGEEVGEGRVRIRWWGPEEVCWKGLPRWCRRFFVALVTALAKRWDPAAEDVAVAGARISKLLLRGCLPGLWLWLWQWLWLWLWLVRWLWLWLWLWLWPWLWLWLQLWLWLWLWLWLRLRLRLRLRLQLRLRR